MKVKIIKSISIADKAPHLPHVHVTEGQVRDDLSEHVANRLIELKHAKAIDSDIDNSESMEVVEDVDNTSDTTSDTIEPLSIREALEAITSEIEDEQEKKAALEKWGKNVLGIDIDKRKSVKKLVKILVSEAKAQGK
jgi:hypothetical protein